MLISLILLTSHGVYMHQSVLLHILIIHNLSIVPAQRYENGEKMLFSIYFKSNKQNIKMDIFKRA